MLQFLHQLGPCSSASLLLDTAIPAPGDATHALLGLLQGDVAQATDGGDSQTGCPGAIAPAAASPPASLSRELHLPAGLCPARGAGTLRARAGARHSAWVASPAPFRARPSTPIAPARPGGAADPPSLRTEGAKPPLSPSPLTSGDPPDRRFPPFLPSLPGPTPLRGARAQPRRGGSPTAAPAPRAALTPSPRRKDPPST